MKTPEELLTTLEKYEDTATAIAVWKEANAGIMAMKEVKDKALACAQADMEVDGVMHHKDDMGSAGWTRPTTPKLDKEKWQGVMQNNERLKTLQRQADNINDALRLAQEETDCYVLPEKRFFIR